MKSNNEEKHNNHDASKENFESSNDNKKEKREQSNETNDQRRRRRPRVGNKAYVADPNNRRTGPTRSVSTSRFQSPDRNRGRDRHPSSDRYSSDRGNRGPVSERRDRYSSPDTDDRGNRENRGYREDSGNRFSSDRGRGGGGGGGRRHQEGSQPRDGRGHDQRRGPRRKPILIKKKPIKQIKYKEDADPNDPIRLNKYLSNAGVCSRREADDHIQAGAVKVNGTVVTELGTKILRSDDVTFNDKPIELESKVYVLLNKPTGFVTTTDDPQNRKTVMDLVKNACEERIYPVGRLDRGTTGVLLLTNDGDLASKLTHPRYEKRKIYQVWVDKPVTAEHMQAIADGFELEDGMIHVDAVSYVTEEDLTQIGVEIHSGRNRIVRRIFEHFDYRVLKLDRVYFAGLTKKKLSRGRWRYLTEKEVNMLRMGAFE
ncbi:MAG: pseudouridine synthase [Bacteroidales bacterium]|nr:pseudouridine synthase [Bacteroidales bacterium]